MRKHFDVQAGSVQLRRAGAVAPKRGPGSFCPAAVWRRGCQRSECRPCLLTSKYQATAAHSGVPSPLQRLPRESRLAEPASRFVDLAQSGGRPPGCDNDETTFGRWLRLVEAFFADFRSLRFAQFGSEMVVRDAHCDPDWVRVGRWQHLDTYTRPDDDELHNPPP